jgi:PAS domain S-box-containing protein
MTALASVLIVDDNPGKRLGMKAILEPLGYSIVEADSGRAALRCLMSQNFAVILLDVQMPDMDGFETAACIRQRRESALTPIIFVTAHRKDDIDRDVYAQGASDFMVTPFPPDELRAKVSAFAALFTQAESLASDALEVKTAADQLRLIADAAPIGIFQTDADNRYSYTNPRWSEITGIPAESAVGQTWDAMIDPEERARLRAELPAGNENWSELCHRFELRQHTAAARFAIITSRSMRDAQGGIAGWVGTLADITAEVGAEAAMADARDKANEASRLKSNFLANMSHEIRTPMNGVIGMTELLLQTELDPRQRAYAQTVRDSGEALLTVLNDILDFSKVEAGMLQIDDVEFDLLATVNGVVDLLAASAATKGIVLTTDVAHSAPATVCGDSGRVRQILINLVGNAIKFTETGEVTIRLIGPEDADTDSVVRFEITDTGVGIPSDKLATIFHPFVQADTSTSRKYGGTGLGLAISSQLAALMGGDCGVASEVGRGSTFWLTVPFRAGLPQRDDGPSRDTPRAAAEQRARVGAGAAPPAEIVESEPVARPRSAQDGSAGLILLAEDNPVNQRVAQAMLESLGYRVDLAPDGAHAIEAATLTRYEAILMDCQMPVVDGYTAAAKIRCLRGGEDAPPIIALTASALVSDERRCLTAGMDDYLTKPLGLKALAAVLERWIPTGSASTPAAGSPEPLAADAGAGRQVRDPQIVERLERLGEATGEDLLGQLAALFSTEADAQVAALQLALADADAATVSRSAHTLSGASANIGATDLARLCSALASDSANGDLVEGAAQLRAVEAELGLVLSDLGSPVAT